MFTAIFMLLAKSMATEVLIPIAVKKAKEYTENTDSNLDDSMLELTQVGANYLANKENNTVTKELATALNDSLLYDDEHETCMG